MIIKNQGFSTDLLSRWILIYLVIASFAKTGAQTLAKDSLNVDSLFIKIADAAPKKQADVYTNLAIIRTFSPEEGLPFTEKVIQLAKTSGNQDILYHALSSKVRFLIKLQKTDSAYSAIKTAMLLAEKSDLKKLTETELLLGQIQYYLNHKDSAAINLQSGMDKMQQINDSAWAGNILFEMGYFYLKSQQYEEAIRAYNKALAIFPSTWSDENFISCYNNLGICYSRLNDFESGLKATLLALDYVDPSSVQAAKMYTTIGIIYGNLRITEKSIEYFLKARDIFEQSHDTIRLITLYTNIGGSFTQSNEPIKALESFRTALKLVDVSGNDSQKLAILVNMASLYNDINKPDSALILLNKAEISPYLRNNKRTISYIYKGKATAYQLKGNTDQAIEHFNKTVALATETHDDLLRQSAYDRLSQVYTDKKDYQKAFQYFKDAVAIRDSIESNEHKAAVEEIITKYEVDLKDKENRILQQDLTIKQQEIRRQKTTNLIVILLAAILLVSLVVTVYIIRLRNQDLFKSREVNKANAKIFEQEIKIREQETQIAEEKAMALDAELNFEKERAKKTTADILKNSEIAARLLNEISQIKPYCNNKEGQDMINSTLADFSGLTAENNWNNFYTDFSTLNKDFFRNLAALDAELSETEKRLAAFIKMGLNTKDIAPITFQSVNTINVTKTRLKNKLNLSTIEELQQFLQQL
ncbi:MAG: tetratricopeptide repeat protein [Bacteroidales bacterium]|nr:tetratricopeptide repeat protein [Bacteroidales bacterium]